MRVASQFWALASHFWREATTFGRVATHFCRRASHCGRVASHFESEASHFGRTAAHFEMRDVGLQGRRGASRVKEHGLGRWALVVFASEFTEHTEGAGFGNRDGATDATGVWLKGGRVMPGVLPNHSISLWGRVST